MIRKKLTLHVKKLVLVVLVQPYMNQLKGPVAKCLSELTS